MSGRLKFEVTSELNGLFIDRTNRAPRCQGEGNYMSRFILEIRRYRQRALWCDAAEICPSLGFVKRAESRVVLLPPEAPMLRGESKTWHCADGSKWL